MSGHKKKSLCSASMRVEAVCLSKTDFSVGWVRLETRRSAGNESLRQFT